MATEDRKINNSASRIIHKQKATVDEILIYVWNSGFVSILEVANRFGYTYGGACARLNKLKKLGRVINDRRGEWLVTKRGEKRLAYIGVRI